MKFIKNECIIGLLAKIWLGSIDLVWSDLIWMELKVNWIQLNRIQFYPID